MRPHFVLMLRRPLQGRVPFWGDFIRDKRYSVSRFMDESLDALFRPYGRVWITREYDSELPTNSLDQTSDAERESGFDRIYRVIFQDQTSLPDALLPDLQSLASVAWVRKGVAGTAELPQFSRQTSRSSISNWPSQMIGLPFAHVLGQGNPDVTVAILDTGIDRDHPEVDYGMEMDFVHMEGMDTQDFIGDVIGVDEIAEDGVGHGTHVAGIISGKGLRMPKGVAPRCQLMIVRVLATMVQNGRRVGAGLIDNINAGMKWAVDRGADVINVSLGVRHEYGGLPHQEVVQYALKKGVSIVAAAGNDGTENKYYPGALPGVIAVGAADRNGHIAPFSSYGARISYIAPGTDILSAFRDGEYAACSGTSQAAPFVSGAVALLKSFAKERNYTLKNEDIDYLLKHTANRVDQRVHNPRGGYGVIQLADALKLLRYELSY